ncbi:MAG: PAS domain-containing protein [Alphaproteobacteria bacterium]|nr:PAS domain-containing protein [Alphaproteobacteria bacterium]MCW5739241.1 PAS domain-containing protein [Alphaproteobacteria bacterium]
MWRLSRDVAAEPKLNRAPLTAPAREQAPPAAKVGGIRIASLLVLFGACLVLPALGGTAYLLERRWTDRQQEIEHRLEQVAGALAGEVDRSLNLLAATLTVLASSPQFDAEQYKELHEGAVRSLKPLGLDLLYRDAGGQMLFNTRVAWGTPLPRVDVPEIDAAIRNTLVPYISNVYVGAMARQPLVSITAPVIRDGEVRGFLHMSIDTVWLQHILRAQGLPPQWNTGLSDRRGIIIARLLRHDDFAGKPLPPELVAASRSRSRDKAFRTVSVEGVEIFRATKVSPNSGWLASANVPVAVARASLIAGVWEILGLAVILLLLVLVLALALGRLVARPIREIAAIATVMEDERIPPALRSSVREVNEVAGALQLSSQRLSERTRALRQALDRFNVALRGADIVVFAQDRQRRLTWISESATHRGQELLGRRDEELLPAGWSDEAIALKERAMKTGHAQEAELKIGVDEEARYFRLRIEPVRDLHGDTVGLLGVSADITSLKQSEQRNAFLVRELAHRSKNLLSVVQAIATETVRSGEDPAELGERLAQRIASLATLQDIAVAGARGGVGLRPLVEAQLKPFVDTSGGRVTIEGPDLRVKPEVSNILGMALHELATNAAKYGALSVPEGRLSIAWRLEGTDGDDRHFHFSWRESDGPPVTPPTRRGFGRKLTGRITAASLKADINLDFPPEGVTWLVDAPASAVLDPAGQPATGSVQRPATLSV